MRSRDENIFIYADDVVLFIQLPITTTTLHVVLNIYSEVSGYKINQNKSSIIGFNIDEETRFELQTVYKTPWLQNGLRYLGIKISDNFQVLHQIM